MLKTIQIIVLAAFLAVSLPLDAGAQQYYIKKKSSLQPADPLPGQTYTKPKAPVKAPPSGPRLAPEPLPADALSLAPCSEQDMIDFKKFDQALNAMNGITEDNNQKDTDEMVEYFTNPKVIDRLSDLYMRCGVLL